MIGIIGPTESEIMPFIEKINDRSAIKEAMLQFYIGSYANVPVVALQSGVCKVNATIATQILIDKFEVSHVILTGVAGGLDERLSIGDIVISTEVAHHDVCKEILTQNHPKMDDIYFKADDRLIKRSKEAAESLNINKNYFTGKIITGETFITDKEREDLIKKFTPLCVDMESASIAHTCYVNKIPFIVIRAISDNADKDGLVTFEENIKLSSIKALKLVESLIEKFNNKGEEY